MVLYQVSMSSDIYGIDFVWQPICFVACFSSHENSCTYMLNIPVVGFSACSHKLLPFAHLTSLVLWLIETFEVKTNLVVHSLACVLFANVHFSKCSLDVC